MSKIDTSKWEKFKISSVFKVKRPAARSQSNYEDGKVPFVASGNYNNGVLKYLSPKKGETLDKGNCITVSPIDGSAFYQKGDFLGRGGAGSSIILLSNDKSNEYSGCFIATVIRAVCKKYYYSDMANKDVIAEETIKLPADENNQPDFLYMESYMKNQEIAVSASLTKLRSVGRFSKEDFINTQKWKTFIIGDLFYKMNLKIKKENFNKTSDVSIIRTPEFSLPLVNAKHFDNGIMYYGRECDFESAEMTVDIVKNGAIATGDVYAQPQRTGVLWDAYLIKPISEITSDVVLLFLATVLEKTIKDKFSYDDKCIWEKVKKLTVRLPIDDEGQPDYVYMEKYMKGVKNRIQNVINRLVAV